MNKKMIAPSFLSANFLNLSADIQMINNSKADYFHLDIMDGVFVPNISFGFPLISAINKEAKLPLDVHLMIVEPDRYIETFAKVGADILTVHYEACPHLHRTIQNIKENGMLAGVSLNPHTNVAVLQDIIQNVDLVLLMSVNPGFGGQKFISNTYDKIKQLRKMIDEKNLKTLIEIDGGVNIENSKKLFDAGADILVAGSSVFKSQNPVETIELLKK
ncbi:MAG: ribulose-phosphate 3-epimerase [Bacteroidota bacterium]|nr:ribulose-phosphate 3-epimerase [Bacteroidota bacterium]